MKCALAVFPTLPQMHIAPLGEGRGCAAGGGVSIALWLPARKHSLVSTVQRNDERIKGLGAPETSNSVPHPSSTWTVGS